MFCGHGLFWDQHVFGPNFILTKTTTMTTATSTTSMGFDTIEINLVVVLVGHRNLTLKFGQDWVNDK